jgi:hypothetical protein
LLFNGLLPARAGNSPLLVWEEEVSGKTEQKERGVPAAPAANNTCRCPVRPMCGGAGGGAAWSRTSRSACCLQSEFANQAWKVEGEMVAQVVVALFESRGSAEDACHRLQTEGVPESEMCLKVLKEIGPVPMTTKAELAGLSVDPMVFGDVQRTFARFIRNGETAVLVHAGNDRDLEFATTTMRHYGPLAIEVLGLPPNPLV